MPRLTPRDYLSHRQFLIQEWSDRDRAAFGGLPLQHQLDLHGSCAPSATFTDREALTHREEMAKAFPSLPQKAGRAYRALSAGVEGTPNRIVDDFRAETRGIATANGKQPNIRVVAVANPQIDHYRLARALLSLAKFDVDGKLYEEAKEKTSRQRSR